MSETQRISLEREFGEAPYIETVSGKKFHFLDPQPAEIDIEDIAHALSMQCRYTGHTSKFYSVAEHSVLVANLSSDNKLTALLHDASEAYLTDVASPVKRFLANYREMERVIMEAVARKFDILWPEPPSVKLADQTALMIEAEQLLPSKGYNWPEFAHIDRSSFPRRKVDCYPPFVARRLFIDTFYSLISGRAYASTR